uniref:Uncharacterized protein LOC104218916 isoform X3 n=1 Tax=Nicotiana sylvestris TaxID=4096 RepID=A0A1U7VZK9_NICSY|nr:PREDICTED: uncharacterized protein LOC104218916 isoform X3 [Nicotiana sylvestris]
MVFKKLVVMMMGCLGCAGQPTEPSSSPEKAESKPLVDESVVVTSPRVKLGDGRYLAYRERGVPKNISTYRIIIVHGFGSSKEMSFMASDELLDELGIYLLIYDRAGYGESSINQKRSLKSEASDIEELADLLQLGSRFYIIGVSLGCYPAWSCIKHIPARKQLCRWVIWITRYARGLLHWWLTQNIFPSASVLDGNPQYFCDKDLDALKNTPGYQLFTQDGLKDRNVFDSLCSDCIVAFGKWDFNPLELSNPYPQNESSVHIWQGHEDKVVPVQLQRHVSQRLPWIRYHEVPDGGHLLVYDRAVCEAVLKSLVLGEDPPLYRPKLEN